MEHLQILFKKLDPTTASNKEILIWYFHKELCAFIQVQINN